MKTHIFPAIDISGSQVVRLINGNYNKKTVYGDDPVSVAEGFRKKGASFLHLVDLDGAKDGKGRISDIVRKIVSATGLYVEVGGGIRTEAQVDSYIEAGAGRVIMGTAALKNPDFLEAMNKKYPGRIGGGIDIKDGFAAIRGWTELSRLTAKEAFELLIEKGIETIICTDISKDGAMKGIDADFYEDLVRSYTQARGVRIIASGGVTTIEDVKRLKSIRFSDDGGRTEEDIALEGIIIGRALYDGKVDLEEAIKC
jgi:phosphoribosylformimino-5-aminoimidazole carboxamide ribotide isomerase